jgi:hypothetical protein
MVVSGRFVIVGVKMGWWWWLDVMSWGVMVVRC